jgi:uncharacterized protein YacL
MPEAVTYLLEFAAVTTATILVDRYVSSKVALIVLVLSLILLGVVHRDRLIAFRQFAIGHRAIAVAICTVSGLLLGLVVGFLVSQPASLDYSLSL